VTGRVYGDESLFDQRRGGLITDYKADTPDLGGQLSALTYDHGTVMPHYNPATFAAHQFVQTMRQLGIQSVAGRHDGTAPEHAQILATVASPPMSAMLRLMNVPSDDLFAEMFAKQLGLRYGTGGTIASGARVIEQTIAARYGLHPTIYDGSGLGRQDRTSPKQIVQLLTELKAQGKRVVGYAATSKSTTVLNYTQVGPDLIQYISDSTPIKQGKFSPGMHIPVVSPDVFRAEYPDYAVLFGWNHKKEILENEKAFTAAGGKWIVFVPQVGVLT